MALIEAKNIKMYFPVQRGFIDSLFKGDTTFVRAIDDVSLQIEKGETLGLAGESGSGKTTMGRLCVRLLKPTEGQIIYDGEDIADIKGKELRLLRRRLQFTFQDPTSSLNPRLSIGNAIADALKFQRLGTPAERKEKAEEVLEKVGLFPASSFYDRLPHQLSGGQKQRVVFGRAIIMEPEFVVTDEPVAMVDVSIKAQLLELMLDLKRDLDLTYLFISHDLATARHVCDRIAIMYLGRVIELGNKNQVYENPLHPYTVGLIGAIPVPDPKARRSEAVPQGEIPSPINPPSGCRFHPRCPKCMEKCKTEDPEFREVDSGHSVACHLF
ncbi:MAG: ABC transporter ATP-binding protein [Candidatus Thorarchaeota archaeon]